MLITLRLSLSRVGEDLVSSRAVGDEHFSPYTGFAGGSFAGAQDDEWEAVCGHGAD